MKRFFLGRPGDFFARHQHVVMGIVAGLLVSVDSIGTLVAGVLS